MLMCDTTSLLQDQLKYIIHCALIQIKLPTKLYLVQFQIYCKIFYIKKPLYKTSSATPFATKFSMKAGKIAVKPIPAKTLADMAELLSMYSNVLGSTSCVKSKL